MTNITIKHTEVYGFGAAIRGMRNPMNSWDKSDSQASNRVWWGPNKDILADEGLIIGEADLKLACKLIKGGAEHRKFLRMIHISADLTLPRYVWQELDTYKVATVRNSCSTMHKLGHRELTLDDFAGSGISPDKETVEGFISVVAAINRLGIMYRETKNYDLVHRMKGMLPEGFLQKATYDMNYETALSMYGQRHNHRLPEWRDDSEIYGISICKWIRSLPYMERFIRARQA